LQLYLNRAAQKLLQNNDAGDALKLGGGADPALHRQHRFCVYISELTKYMRISTKPFLFGSFFKSISRIELSIWNQLTVIMLPVAMSHLL
jgi:hypothetical protein